jgi:DNA (cytosine-5)-methyltransferase 1
MDLFSGAGGLTEGLRQAGFETKLAIEIDKYASQTYSLNHKKTKVITQDIRKVNLDEIKEILGNDKLHLLAGCPPCQGFSSIRRLNRKQAVSDERNSLINEYIRFVEFFNPYTIMLENVPLLLQYDLFISTREKLEKMGYKIDAEIVDVKKYGVPQSRKRLVMVGSKLGTIKVAGPNNKNMTVRDCIEKLPCPECSTDRLHKIYPIHSKRIQDLISLIPKDGGSRKDLGSEMQLKCHKKANVGFNDIYGRLRWDAFSTTITGGCLNPSKGRFLHPEQNRCISAREAALLQSFPMDYKFPADIPTSRIALMIGNALPPKFSYYQAMNIKRHLLEQLIKKN